MYNSKKGKQSGFTLIELAIVLVIIGLITAGVLAGQTLIEQAKIRGQIRQIQEFDTAIATFQTKYSALPGDFASATRYFIVDGASGNLVVVDGDGDGTIEGDPATTGAENSNVLYHLALSDLISGSSGQTAVLDSTIGRGGFQFFADARGVGSYGIGVEISGTDAAGFKISNGTWGNGMTGIEAESLDTKLDDGRPNSGNMEVAAVNEDLEAVNNDGTVTGTPDNNCAPDGNVASLYVVGTTDTVSGETPVCPIKFRTAF